MNNVVFVSPFGSDSDEVANRVELIINGKHKLTKKNDYTWVVSSELGDWELFRLTNTKYRLTNNQLSSTEMEALRTVIEMVLCV